tara:strand:- start:255 stop:656 length:402 start_codon:yes stop_codon:yes gene_type:complete
MLFLRPIYTNTTTQREGNNMKTITFKTGRVYDFEQVITAFSEDNRTITFYDSARDVYYAFNLYSKDTSQDDIEFFELDQWDQGTVMSWYDGDREGRPDVSNEPFNEAQLMKIIDLQFDNHVQQDKIREQKKSK